MSTFSVETFAILASLNTIQWSQISQTNEITAFLGQILRDQAEKATSHFVDEFLIQIVALCGIFAVQPTEIASRILSMSGDLISLLNRKLIL